jgi:putative heme-binding domain-containing protein
MDQKFRVAFGAVLALVCGLWLSNQAFGETLPDGKGKAEFIHNCTACHRADMVTRVKKTPDEWRKSVDDMAARGTDGTKEDLDNVVLYLDTYYAADKPSPAATAASAAPSSNSASPASSNESTVTDSAEIERVKRLISGNACLACHRIEQQGSYLGPSLNGLGARRTAAEIRAAIVSPQPTLDPKNNMVRFTTADGTVISGRILSQDDRSVRVIDASGKVADYSKRGLQQFTVVTTNPMPSYQGKIAGEDLDRLVRYLDSLQAVDENVGK